MTLDKTINIAINADASGVKTGMTEAAEAMQQGTAKMKTAAESVATATSAADNSVKTLQQSYRAAYRDAQRIAEQQGITSQAFKEAAATAGEYKNKLDDVKQVTQALSSDTPIFKASLDVVKGVASGIGAVSGAIGIFAENNKELEVWAHRAQSALALMMGLEGLGGLADALRTFGQVVKINVIPAMVEFGAVLLANPITAIATALAAAATAFGIYKLATEESAQAEKQLKEVTIDTTKNIDEQTASIRKHNEELKIQLSAKQKGIQVDAVKASQIDAEIKAKEKLIEQYKQEQQTYNTNLLTGKNLWSAKQDLINKTYDEIHSLNDLKLALKDSADLQDKISKQNKTHKNASATITTKSNAFETIEQLKQIPNALEAIKMPAEKITQMLETPKNAIGAFATDFINHIDTMKSALMDMAVNGIAQFSASLGKGLAGANEDFGAMAGQFIASIASTIGQGMIAIGTPMLFTVAGAAEGAAMIAAGAAIIAAGAAFGQMTSSSAPTSGGASASNSYVNSGMNNSYVTPNVNSVQMMGVLYGNDILISTKKSEQQYSRVK